jgi:hypothetical protein
MPGLEEGVRGYKQKWQFMQFFNNFSPFTTFYLPSTPNDQLISMTLLSTQMAWRNNNVAGSNPLGINNNNDDGHDNDTTDISHCGKEFPTHLSRNTCGVSIPS